MADDLSRPIAAGYHAGLGYATIRPSRTPAGMIGEQLGSQVGSSVEFMDYREYTPGDDLRRVDWSVYGRTRRDTRRRSVWISHQPSCDAPALGVVVTAAGEAGALITSSTSGRNEASWFLNQPMFSTIISTDQAREITRLRC